MEMGAIKGKGGKGLDELVGNLDRWHTQLIGARSVPLRTFAPQQARNDIQSESVDGEVFEGDLKDNYQSPLDELGGTNDGPHGPAFTEEQVGRFERLSPAGGEENHIELAR